LANYISKPGLVKPDRPPGNCSWFQRLIREYPNWPGCWRSMTPITWTRST